MVRAKRKYTAEEIVMLLRQMGVDGERQDDTAGVPGSGITEQTYYRWRKVTVG